MLLLIAPTAAPVAGAAYDNAPTIHSCGERARLPTVDTDGDTVLDFFDEDDDCDYLSDSVERESTHTDSRDPDSDGDAENVWPNPTRGSQNIDGLDVFPQDSPRDTEFAFKIWDVRVGGGDADGSAVDPYLDEGS